jgi:hypothetical protein
VAATTEEGWRTLNKHSAHAEAPSADHIVVRAADFGDALRAVRLANVRLLYGNCIALCC